MSSLPSLPWTSIEEYSNLTLWGSNGTEILNSPNYKDKGFQEAFIYINAIVRLAFGLFEMMSNGLILHITRKYRSELKSSCFLLLAMNACCDILVASSTLITAFLTPFGMYKVTNCLCFWLMAIPEIAFNMSFVLIFFIALDRLTAIQNPIWYHSLRINRYLGLLFSISLLLAIFLFSFAVKIWAVDETLLLRCTIVEFWHEPYIRLLQPFSLFFTVSAILCYLTIWIRLKVSKIVNIQVSNDVLKSLAILVWIILFCWVLGMALRSLIPWLISAPIPLGAILMNFTDLTITFNGSANALVLYFCCKDYRRLMRKELFKNISQNGASITVNIQYPAAFHSNMPILFRRMNSRIGTTMQNIDIENHNNI